MTIKELRTQLRAWGRFWGSKEYGVGYSSSSSTERCCEVLKTGIWASSTKHLFAHYSDSCHTPAWVDEIDAAISKLPEAHRIAITRAYKKAVSGKMQRSLHLQHAESALLGLM